MSLLYSNILPMRIKEGMKIFREQFDEEIVKAKALTIAVGYISQPSLLELEKIVDENHIEKVTLIIGMYAIEGFPERSLNETRRLAQKWKDKGIGEIRLVKPLKYYGKLYAFHSEPDSVPYSAFIGSANLSVLCPDAPTLRQYELSITASDKQELMAIQNHIQELCKTINSQNILELDNSQLTIIREVNDSLLGVERVEHLPKFDLEYYNGLEAELFFDLPIKVPRKSERFLDDSNHYTRSNINVCYAKPRNQTKSRDWYEMQLTVTNKITRQPGYPEKNVPFFILTDDGYIFKAHTTSQNNKQFAAVGDELIMGRWFKGRLAAAGLVHPVNDTGKDTDRTGMITQEMIDAYGISAFRFEKTVRKIKDKDGQEYDLWRLSVIKMRVDDYEIS